MHNHDLPGSVRIQWMKRVPATNIWLCKRVLISCPLDWNFCETALGTLNSKHCHWWILVWLWSGHPWSGGSSSLHALHGCPACHVFWNHTRCPEAKGEAGLGRRAVSSQDCNKPCSRWHHDVTKSQCVPQRYFAGTVSRRRTNSSMEIGSGIGTPSSKMSKRGTSVDIMRIPCYKTTTMGARNITRLACGDLLCSCFMRLPPQIVRPWTCCVIVVWTLCCVLHSLALCTRRLWMLVNQCSKVRKSSALYESEG